MAEAAVEVFQGGSVKNDGNQVWCHMDRPVEKRATINALFGIKRMLASWNLTKKAIEIIMNFL